MERRLDLSENERAALKLVLNLPLNTLFGFSGLDARMAVASMLERSVPRRPDVRYVVKCQGRRRSWEKVYFDKTAAQEYARHAVDTWCRRENVRIMKQKWISF